MRVTLEVSGPQAPEETTEDSAGADTGEPWAWDTAQRREAGAASPTLPSSTQNLPSAPPGLEGDSALRGRAGWDHRELNSP